MAYICGAVTKEERVELERRGWDIEPRPQELVDSGHPPDVEYIMIYVDGNMFDVMSGPDWDRGE